MKIGILTQPLGHNYGGIFQNYALQQTLLRFGHDPLTIDLQPEEPLRDYIISCFKSFKARPRRSYSRPELTGEFIRKNIRMSRPVSRCSASILEEYGIDALLVGSDQVWRPKYNAGVLDDMFLSFARNVECPKASYAASFGTSDLSEYSPAEICRCRKLLAHFDAVSVREDTAVELCRRYFFREASLVLDPTLLLERSDYEALCCEIPKSEAPFAAFYCLDDSPEKLDKARKIAKDKSLELRQFTSGSGLSLTPQQWLSTFRDASLVITDSYHGRIFAGIFGKPVHSLGSASRGNDRFQTLDRLIGNASEFENCRRNSLDFLRRWLNCR